MWTVAKCSALLAFFVSTAFAANENWRKCQLNPKTDLNYGQVLYLHPGSSEILYPQTPDNFSFAGEEPVIRVACPAGNIVIGNDVIDFTSVHVECLSGHAMKINNTCNFGPLSEIGCTNTAMPISRLTTRKTPNGKKLAEIGYSVGSSEFVPVIDQIQVSKHDKGYITRWLHYKASPVFNVQQSGVAEKSLTTGLLSEKLGYDRVYNRDLQKEQFLATFKDQETVDKYLPGGESFVAGQLVTSENFYYEAEQNATYLYETTAPIWSSVNSGNWKLVNEVVRNLTEQFQSDIDVWSGTYLNLWLRNADKKVTYIDLPTEMKPSQFLFKYVYDKSNDQGVVFVTVNNPHLTELKSSNKLCSKLTSCELQYPEFTDFKRGYTYCCTLNDFESYAVKLGIPVFEESPSIYE